ncbi:MAG: hypothetical protein U0289_14155 [Cyclobacteriaceae bacterium]
MGIIDGKKERNRKPLSNRLLTSEARLINEIIIGRLAKEFPDSTAYTVFDSILIDEDHVDLLFRIMTEESEKYFGFACQLEMKENDVESKLKRRAGRMGSIKPRREIVKYSQTIDDCKKGLEDFGEYVKAYLGDLSGARKDDSETKVYEHDSVATPENKLRLLQAGKITMVQYCQIKDVNDITELPTTHLDFKLF